MTLLVIDKQHLYHFANPEDAQFWVDNNPDEDRESLIFYPNDEYDEEFQEFLDDHYPLEIIMK